MNLGQIKGIGKKKEYLLNSMGIYTAQDLVAYLPRRYEDRSNKVLLVDADTSIKQYFELKVLSQPKTHFYNKNKSITRVSVEDSSSQANIIWYNDRFSARSLQVNETYKFFGYFDKEKKALINPLIAKLNQDSIGGISPIYTSVKGISSKEIIKYKDYLFSNRYYLNDFLDKDFLEKERILNINDMYANLHKPKDNLSLYQAFFSLNFRKIYLEKLANKIYKEKMNLGYIKFSPIDLSQIENKLEFSLTRAQKLALNQIQTDMYDKKRMNRILIGDVGSGKTIVAILSAIVAIKNGYQVSFMAPTEILANQHYNKYKDFFDQLSINSDLITGSSKTNEKAYSYQKILDNQTNIVFGTHALFQDKVEFAKLGLVIMDEQQRFGVYQRKRLVDKGLYPDILLLSATPIPRTLALSLYSDLDISYIDELPKNRLKIKSYLSSIYQEKDFINFAYKQVTEGRQVYIISSRVEENDDFESVDSLYRKLNKYFKSNVKLAKLHGGMDSNKKESVQRDFLLGKIDMLIATSIVEVGVDVSNATTMIIYDANQFGLSQLHQLRGRVGRSNIQSYCFFVAKELTVENDKLEFIVNNDDGFEIAKKDLQIRGQGNLFGKDQSGYIDTNSSFLINDDLVRLVNMLVDKTDSMNDHLKNIIDEKIQEMDEIILNWGNMSLRVIAGLRKGHNLRGPLDYSARPTESKVKESIFNIISNIEEDEIALDLFAATGSIGIEFLSRGAKKVYFSENNRDHIENLKWNLNHTKFTEQAVIMTGDFRKNLLQINENIDYVYLDPPYKSDYYNQAFDIMLEKPFFKNALYITEMNNDYDFTQDYENLELLVAKRYGKKYLKFYREKIWE